MTTEIKEMCHLCRKMIDGGLTHMVVNTLCCEDCYIKASGQFHQQPEREWPKPPEPKKPTLDAMTEARARLEEEFKLERDDHGFAAGISIHGYWLIHFDRGTVRNEENAQAIVDALNGDGAGLAMGIERAKNVMRWGA